MRPGASNRRDQSGFTLVEILITTVAIGIITTVMFALLNFGITLFARNVRVNMAHQEARNGMMRVVRDLHQAVSIPQLVDANLKTVDTTGPTAGITFQIVTSGPFQLMNDPSAPQLLQVSTTKPNPPPPSIGDHIVVLDYDIETDIVDVTATGVGTNHWNLFLTNANEKRISTKSGSFVICYITRRAGYVVKNGQLCFYPNLIATPTTYSVIAHNITSATPFSIPLNDSGTPDTRYTSVNITATDPTYSNRGYKNTSMQMVDARVPYRCQVTKYQ
jgi:prepilin-type N-terminal cleavage/methylation domain-containing protein